MDEKDKIIAFMNDIFAPEKAGMENSMENTSVT